MTILFLALLAYAAYLYVDPAAFYINGRRYAISSNMRVTLDGRRITFKGDPFDLQHFRVICSPFQDQGNPKLHLRRMFTSFSGEVTRLETFEGGFTAIMD